MSGARDHLDPSDDRSPAPGLHRAPETGHAAAIAGDADPRLTHGGAGAGLLHLQRTAGNAAVRSLVAPAVQREVTIDEVGIDMTNPYDEAPAPGPAAEAPTAPAGAAGAGPVTSDGATTTISGGTINLEAGLTQTAGIIRAGTIIADNVVGSNYTPGAGNVW